jgi:protein-disulfide isomerase
MHQNAMPAALAAMAANEQGKFWEYHDKLFANQQKLQKDNLLQYAKDLKLDVKKFEDSLGSPKIKSQVDADASEAASIGMSGTPAFLLNGRYLSGAKPYEEFQKAINAELTRLNIPIPPKANAPAGG